MVYCHPVIEKFRTDVSFDAGRPVVCVCVCERGQMCGLIISVHAVPSDCNDPLSSIANEYNPSCVYTIIMCNFVFTP